MQDRICAAPVFQPHFSDACGAVGLGKRPTRQERIAWEGRDPASCAALRDHVARFPSGAYRDEVTRAFAAKRVITTEAWDPNTRNLRLHVSQSDQVSLNESEAREATMLRALSEAEQMCKDFAATTRYRFRSAQPVVRSWDCSRTARGVACALDAEVDCAILERRDIDVEICSSSDELTLE